MILVSRWEGGTVVAILDDEGASVLDLRVVVGTVRRGGGDGRERRGGGEYLKAEMRLRCLFHAIAANNTFNINISRGHQKQKLIACQWLPCPKG